MKLSFHLNRSFDQCIPLPPSKSISNRALVINALSEYPVELLNLAACDDTVALQQALHLDTPFIDVGAAGTAYRFLCAYLSIVPGEWFLSGSRRMHERPIGKLVEALKGLGADITYLAEPGYPPLRIKGRPLEGGSVVIDGSISSQYVSGLMMIGPTLRNGLDIEVEGKIGSRPYIEMTQQMMYEFGVNVSIIGNTIHVPSSGYCGRSYTIESDWSAASYWYAIFALTSLEELRLRGLSQFSSQGDSVLARLFELFGIVTTYTREGVVLTKRSWHLDTFDYDFTDQPDLTQTFAVMCALLDIPYNFMGVDSLKIKETNRVEALRNELRRLGFVVTEPFEGVMKWDGERCETSYIPSISTYKDHRMAMSFALAAIVKEIEIEEPEVVSKSYPTFWEDLALVGFKY